jgi:AhpD family alkylhydroperoxidase
LPSPYRYTSPVPKKGATGQVAAIYAQIAAEFILADGPLMSLSPAPDLLAATWALLREAQVAGAAPRVTKEVVAAAVSAANHCQFCVDAHTTLIHASGEHQLAEAIWRGQTPADPAMARLVTWSKATATSDGEIAPPVADELAPEYLGTAMVTHFINRMVSSLLNETLLPGRLQESTLVRRIAGRTFGRTVHLRPRAGESLPLLGDIPGCAPDWAGATPIGAAYAALRAAANAGAALLSVPAQGLVLATVAAWDPGQPLLGDQWRALQAALPATDRSGAKLALLAALAPHSVTDVDVVDWRERHPADADLVRLIAFGAFTAVERIEASLSPRPRSLQDVTVVDRPSSAA